MTVAVAALSVVVFAIAFHLSGVVRTGAAALEELGRALKTMSSAEIGDDEKERAAQNAAMKLLGSAASILIRSAIAVLAAFAPI
ncbi:MAG: hypothetical protein AAGL49_03500, partial [Pseudomonadota bacterium]